MRTRHPAAIAPAEKPPAPQKASMTCMPTQGKGGGGAVPHHVARRRLLMNRHSRDSTSVLMRLYGTNVLLPGCDGRSSGFGVVVARFRPSPPPPLFPHPSCAGVPAPGCRDRISSGLFSRQDTPLFEDTCEARGERSDGGREQSDGAIGGCASSCSASHRLWARGVCGRVLGSVVPALAMAGSSGGTGRFRRLGGATSVSLSAPSIRVTLRGW